MIQIPNYTKAAYFAAIKHSGQLRKNAQNQPYINHPLQVANFISNSGVNDPVILCAAVLHDTLQDTQTTEEEIKQNFGEEVLNIVKQCSDDKSLDKVARKVHQIQHSKHISQKAKIIKLADKLSNMESLSTSPPKSWSKQRIRGYVLWGYEVCKQMEGASPQIENALNNIYKDHNILNLKEEEKTNVLKAYYDCLVSSQEK